MENMSTVPARHCYLVITELFLPTKGGTAVWFDEVYRRIGDLTTHIVTAQVPGSEDCDAQHPNSIHRLSLDHSRWIRPASLPKYLKLFFVSLWLALKHRFDAVHAGRVLPEGLVALVVARLTGHPVVIYAHGEEITTWRRSPRRLRAMRFAYRHADKVIANSAFTRDQLHELGVASERITVISPGVDNERYRPNLPCKELRELVGIPEQSSIILSVGRLSRRKGFDQVIRSLSMILEKNIDVHYVVIGIGEDEIYLQRLANELGVLERVHFLGHVSMDDLPRWYNAADVFAMPNREINGDTEGFGMVYIEASACGKPVVGGLAGGTAAAIAEGYSGYRVDGDSVDAVADALCKLLSDRDLASKLGRQGFERAMEEYSWDRVADKTKALLGKTAD